MKPLAIGKDFSLPVELATGSIGILATKGGGKSYAAAVLSEELLDAVVPVIIIDPTGAHWGLKSSATGKSEGYPMTIFGGDHADLPLEEGAGEVLAHAFVEKRFPCILDMSHFRKSQVFRFLTPFLENLYRLNRSPMHLICDEADAYAPQKSWPDVARCLGAMEDIVRRGRIRGIGSTLISQRPSSVNKDVLTQCDCLFCMRISHPRDVAPVMEWIDMHADRKTGQKMLESLASLPTGTAWIWAPRLDIFERVEIRRRGTFDSSSTPKIGEHRIEPTSIAKVDLEALGQEIAATVQRAKENDPKELKAQITKLKSELAKKPAAVPPEIKTVEVSVLTDEDRKWLSKTAVMFEQYKEAVHELGASVEPVTQRLYLIASKLRAPAPRLQPTPPRMPAHEMKQREESTAAVNGSDFKLGSGHRKILTVLAQYPDGKDTTALAHVAGFTVNGHFNNMLGALRGAGFVNRGQPVTITADGTAALGTFTPLPTGDELREYWLRKVSNSEAKILRVLFDRYPHEIATADLAAEAGYTVNGHFNNMMGHLRTIELIEGRGMIRASATLFE